MARCVHPVDDREHDRRAEERLDRARGDLLHAEHAELAGHHRAERLQLK
jgi:hypothetical protein